MYLPLFRRRDEGTTTPTLSDYIKSLSGLVAYYPLDEASGNAINQAPDTLGSYDGTVVGMTQNVDGLIGKAYSSDGVGDQLTLGAMTPYANAGDSFTFGFIAKITNLTTEQKVVSIRQDGPTNKGCFIGVRTDGKARIAMGGSSGSLYASVYFIAGQFHLYSISIVANDWSLYRDGVLIVTGAVTSREPSSTIDAFAFEKIGIYQHLFFYNKSLSSDEHLGIAKRAGLA